MRSQNGVRVESGHAQHLLRVKIGGEGLDQDLLCARQVFGDLRQARQFAHGAGGTATNNTCRAVSTPYFMLSRWRV